MNKNIFYQVFFSVFIALCLSACGGEGFDLNDIQSSIENIQNSNLSDSSPNSSDLYDLILNPIPEPEPISNLPPTPEAPQQQPIVSAEQKYLTQEDVLHNAKRGAEQLNIMCQRMTQSGVKNRVTQAFCSAVTPDINSIRDLQLALGLNVDENGRNRSTQFTLTGHSSSLVMKFTNAINPRAIIFSSINSSRNNGLVAMGFVRGEQFAEIIAGHFDPDNPNDPRTNELEFYLLNFEQTCNSSPEHCSMGHLLSDAVERNWTSWSMYHEEDLKNTVLDCRQCHQPNGTGTAKAMLMQELVNPWNHFFRANRDGGRALLDDYAKAHDASEPYAGIAGNRIRNSDPEDLEDLIRAFGFNQIPNVAVGTFNSRRIENEIVSATPAQPASNAVSGTSATWQQLYERNVRGETIQVPYHDVKITNSSELDAMATTYRAYMQGSITDMPDIRDIFKESDLRNMGFKVQAGLDGRGILIQACTQCHNDTLDQTISRANFSVNIDRMSVSELKIAQQRIQMPEDHLLVMPPSRFRVLDANERQRLVNYLETIIQQKSLQ